MNTVVVGAGIYGTTVAIHLAKLGHKISLYEKSNDILTAASTVNQYRLHLGFHYPRSVDTIQSCLRDTPKFEEAYSDAILQDIEHYYCVAKKDSFTSPVDFLKVCDENGLEYEKTEPPFINKNEVALSIKVKENALNLAAVKKIIKKRLDHPNITLHLNTYVKPHELSKNLTIVCTYASTNELLNNLDAKKREYQFELVEKIVIRLPEEFHKQSFVIMDGPFTCVDPLGQTGLYLMGHVVHALHTTNVGSSPIIPPEYKDFINNGLIKNPPHTKAPIILKDASKFLPILKKAEHVGSYFTVRTVLPRKDDTDERPTIVTKVNNQLITVYSGKLSNCVSAAEDVGRIIESLN